MNGMTFHKIRPFVFCIIFSLFFTTLLRLFNTQQTFNLLQHSGYVISFTLIFTFTAYLWQFSFRRILLFLFPALLYESVNILKINNEVMLNERAVLQTAVVAAVFSGLASVFFYVSGFSRSKLLKFFCRAAAIFFTLLSVLPPLLINGYSVVSGGKIISTDIILTLFQTNAAEIAAYLHEQNLYLWSVCSVIIFAVTTVFVYCSCKTVTFPVFRKTAFFIILLFLFYLLLHDLPRMTLELTVNLVQSTRTALNSFKEFKLNDILRQAKIAELKSRITGGNSGVYVLVLGESTARNHMHAYGYARGNTPWLDSIKNESGTVLFTNAYSNHVHTVPAVTYALTEQNQYEDIALKDVLSLIDVATAAGYETYWLSNQKRFGLADTPIAVIAQSADHKIFLNEYVGHKSVTTYYDSKLAEEFPDLRGKNKAFILVHLMGCHAVYADRYETEFNMFDSGNTRVDTYDNCIAYNDKVLSLLYDRVKDNPDFMAYVYLSDHGEDPDNGLTHESSKFTYAMSRIPFFIVFSEKYRSENPQIFQNLQVAQDIFWSSDLLFNLMTDIFNIHGLQNTRPEFSPASGKYRFTRDDILTLHGQKKIADEK